MIKFIASSFAKSRIAPRRLFFGKSSESLTRQSLEDSLDTDTFKEAIPPVGQETLSEMIGLEEADLEQLEERSLRGDKEILKSISLKNYVPHPAMQTIDFSRLKQVHYSSPDEFEKIPSLAKSLEIVVKEPGIYRLADMKKYLGNEHYEFLKHIPQPDQLDFSQFGSYSPPSQDQNLLEFAKRNKCKYMMSTSTISYFLSHVYYLLCCFKEPNFSNMSTFQGSDRPRYMNAQKKPFTNFLNCVDRDADQWTLDGDSGMFTPVHLILIQMGNILEKLYTMEPGHFNSIFLKAKQNLSLYPPLDKDYHRFMILNDKICLRSQIDCKAPTDSGHIVFEIKSRAVAPLRYEVANYQKFLDYRIQPIYGEIHSYEREYYDLIRGAFLKYFFQLKIGQMNGAFIGYHNTVENFGFEYVKRETIEKLLFGDSYKADLAFMMSSGLISYILDKVTEAIRKEDFKFVKLGYYADSLTHQLIVMAELQNTEYTEFKSLEMDPVKGMENVVDFYEKVVGKKNLRVIRFEVKLYPFLNGLHNLLFYHDMVPGDAIEFKGAVQNCGYISYEEYMHFLLNAYKYEYTMQDSKFLGSWVGIEKRYFLNN